jgi:hypothetical protein
MASRQRRELFGALGEEGTAADQNRNNALLRKRCESCFEIAVGSGTPTRKFLGLAFSAWMSASAPSLAAFHFRPHHRSGRSR